MLDALRDLAREQDGRSRDPTAAGIDSPSVATTESDGPEESDAGKKVKGRKRHMTVNPQGSPISILVPEAFDSGSGWCLGGDQEGPMGAGGRSKGVAGLREAATGRASGPA